MLVGVLAHMVSDLSTARRAAVFAAAAVLAVLAGCSKPLNSGAMSKLVVVDHPAPAPATVFHDAAGVSHTLADFRGKVAVVNVWANWCAPCKLEIPSLAKLQTEYAGKPVAVLPVSVGKGEDEPAGHAFIDRNPPLTFYSEPTYKLAFAFSPVVENMPTTIIYDKKGVERARLSGGADWSGPDARKVIDLLLGES